MRFGQQSSRLTGHLLSGSGRVLIGHRRTGLTGGLRARIGLLTCTLATAVSLGSAGPASAASTPLQYFGGPVVHSANIVLVEWGPDVRASYINPTTGDPAFFRYLSSQNGTTTDIGGVLAQYMDTTRHNSQNRFTFRGAVEISPSVAAKPPGKVLDAQIQSVLANQIKLGALPAPSGNGLTTLYVVLFPPGDDVCFDSTSCAYSGGGFCAYHGSFRLSGSSAQVLYAPIVDNGPGTPNYGGCGRSPSDLGDQTSVVSHEVSESINDPLNQVASWYDYKFNGEIADKCDAQPAASNGPWTVESLWSNKDKRCAAGEPAYHAPTASFLASSTATAGLPVTFNAGSSTDPNANTTSALDQPTNVSYSIPSGIVGYRWNWGDGSSTVSSANPSMAHTFTQSGNYQVSLTVTDALGFTSTKTQQISVSASSPGTPAVTTGNVTGTSAQGTTLGGTINPEGQTVDYYFAYGTDPGALNQMTPDTSGLTGQTTTPVSATLSGLSPSTTYYYKLVVNWGANTESGAEQSFTTSSSSPPPPKPVVATGTAQTVSSSGARLIGTINPDGLTVAYYFRYGTSALNRAVGLGKLSGVTAKSVSASLTGLSPATTYHYQLVARVGSSTSYTGTVKSLTTTAPLSSVVTGAAGSITSHSAVVSGLVDPRGTSTIYQVQYGRTNHYGLSTTWITAGSGTTYRHVSLALFGLSPATTYHYRLVAQNKHGTTVGADRPFTTARASGSTVLFRLAAPSPASWSGLLSHPLPVEFSCSRGCRAHFFLVAEPSGRAGDALSMTLATGQAQLRHGGSGTASVGVLSRFQSRVREASARPGSVVLMGYATAGAGTASAPAEALIRLGG